MLKKILLSLGLILFLNHLAFAQEIGSVSQVREMLKDGTIDSNKSCLDEYMKRRNHLWISMGLGVPLAPVDVIGGGFVGALGGYAVDLATAGALAGVVEPVLLGVYFGWLGGIALAVGWEIRTAVEIVKNGFLIKVIAEARAGQASDKFMQKYLRKYKKDRELATPETMAKIIANVDERGALCDGSLSKKGHRSALRYKLASKKNLFTYIHAQLNQ